MENLQHTMPGGASMPGPEHEGAIPGSEVPASPAEAEVELSEDEMRADLDGTMADLKNKRGAINSESYISKNKIDSVKAGLIQQIFAMLQEIGVDPTNMESIQAFISQLEKDDPELLRLFNIAFEALEGTPGTEPVGISPSPEVAAPGGMPPVGVADIPQDQPMPVPPVGAGMPEAPPSPGLGDKYGNVAGMMPQ